MKTQRRRPVLLLMAALSTAACSGGGGGAENAVRAAGALHLEGWSGTPGALWGEASYKVKGEGAALVRTLEVEVAHGKPGVSHALRLDGVELGKMIVDLEGEAEFELQRFPEGFVEPKAGSAIEIGDLLRLRLDEVHELIDLQSVIRGPGTLSGKIGFKKERVGEAISKEFQVKLAGAPAESTHAVTLGDVKLGELVVDDDGEGKLEISTKLAGGFPDSIPEPAAGSTVRVGELLSARLEPKPGD